MRTQLDYMRERASLLGAVTEEDLSLDTILALRDLEQARWAHRFKLLERSGDPCASFLTGTNVELIYASSGAGTAKNTFTTEVAINDTAGMGVQAHLPADFWLPSKGEIGRGIRIVGRGILSSTATPTYTFSIRSGAAASITAAKLLGSAALTTISGAANQAWELEGDTILEVIGAAGANSTIRGTGQIQCGGLASPFNYPVWGGGASPGTDATFDTSIVNYINFNVACSASSASNTITLQQLLVFGLN